jgi:raffinose/stachyose/melibiose transport system substrate-binding protein
MSRNMTGSRLTVARVAVAIGGLSLVAASLAGCSADGAGDGKVSITFLAGGNDASATALAQGLVDAFEKENPDITVKIDTRPTGADGDNLIKTQLSTGTMNDVFFYNSGSLFQALNPDSTLQPLTDEPWVAELSDDFVTTVSTDNGVYGAPWGSTFDGGVLYNKKVYEQLGLEVPDTWDDFISNSQAIKAAGIIPVLQSYGDTWTSQLFVLADFANVAAADENWADDYTTNKAKYADAPAFSSFDHTAQVHDLGLLNEDFASLTNVDALKLLATGDAAQYPMISVVIGNVIANNPDNVDDIGYFAMPSDAGDSHATVWEANGAYIPKSTTGAKLEAAKKFVAFINSPAGCEVQNAAGTVAGPYAISSCKVPDDAPALVVDEQAYQDAGKTTPALEFLSPVKGPNLEKILVEVGSGITSAQAGAARYDEDVKAQAQQLGLPGW